MSSPRRNGSGFTGDRGNLSFMMRRDFGSEADGEADLRVEIAAGMVGALVAVQVTLVDPPQTEVGLGANGRGGPPPHTPPTAGGKGFRENGPVECPPEKCH